MKFPAFFDIVINFRISNAIIDQRRYSMYYFVNDYNDICTQEILCALKDASDEKISGYGFDSHSENARNLIKKSIKCESADIHFVPGGTSANILGCCMGLKQQESVIAATTGHIQGHEAGSIEAAGIKIETVNTTDGKLSKKLLEKKLKNFGSEYMTIPKKVYISNTTELGTVYSKEEIKEIYDFCKEKNLYLYIDGARMASAIVSESSNLKLEDIPKICDCFTLGGTKNGMLFGEALVIVNDELKQGFLNLQKQKGAMLAKTFIAGIMYETAFKTDDAYLKGARHAHEMAKLLAYELENVGIPLSQKFESNQIFFERTKEETEELKKIAAFEIMEKLENGNNLLRFVTTYRTTKDDIEGFIKQLR